MCGGSEEIGKGALRSIHRNVQFPGQHIDAPYMVRVLVRDEKGLDPACIDAGPLHPQEAFFCVRPESMSSEPRSPSMTTQLPLLPLARIVQRIICSIRHLPIRAFDWLQPR